MGQCVVKQLGDDCAQPTECESGLCVDGVCCASSCTDLCFHCSGKAGECILAPPGTPDPDCDVEETPGVCDGTGKCVAGHLLWIDQYGGNENEGAPVVDGHPDGRIVVAGTFTNEIFFNSTKYFGTDQQNSYIVGIDAANNMGPVKVFPGPAQQLQAVAIGPTGEVAIAGSFRGGALDLGGGALSAGDDPDLFVALFDWQLNPIWSRDFGDEDDQIANAVGFADGHVVSCGSFQGDLGGQLVATDDSWDAYVVMQDASNGNWAKHKQFAGPSFQGCAALAVNPAGYIFLAGTFGDTVDFGDGHVLSAVGVQKSYVVKLDFELNTIWANGYGLSGTSIMQDIALTPSGEVVVVGTYDGEIDFGGNKFTTSGSKDVFVARLESGGGHLTSLSIGGPGDDASGGVTVDSEGNIIVSGSSHEGYIVDAHPIEHSGNGRDMYLFKLSPQGNMLWSRMVGNDGDQIGTDLRAKPFGELFVVGTNAGTLELGTTSLKTQGGKDVFFALFGR